MARTPNPKNPGNSRTGQAKQKIALTRRSLRRLRPQKKEPVQLVEMPPIPLSETSPQGIKRECKTRHSKIKGRGPKKAIRHSKFKTHKKYRALNIQRDTNARPKNEPPIRKPTHAEHTARKRENALSFPGRQPPKGTQNTRLKTAPCQKKQKTGPSHHSAR